MREVCADARLSALLDDELGEVEALAVARHTAACPSCAAELEDLRRTRLALRSLPPVGAPPDALFRHAVAAAARVDEQRRRTHFAWAGAGVLTAFAATAVWMAGATRDGTVVPPMDRFVADHVGRVDHGPLVTPVDFGR